MRRADARSALARMCIDEATPIVDPERAGGGWYGAPCEDD